LPEVRFAWRQRTYCTAAFRQEQFGAMPSRRFPPPWSVEELDACYVVVDSAGQQLAYVFLGVALLVVALA
jgi:hypothetical protein